ncbi:hypothetical protein [Pseudoroseicyclus aestuarii]|uniref:Sulfotransferase family protein n=1 Tax=Pseudoroseicyclus aestuarii TaxID=1795041 RepID=A0A318SNI3_9RHOB|nr:hypothetical protein [Pseudoroseicyclus aestuarii]PYE82165.1 hypothetical protein DFP88_1055 [Pseudoroseicyclus aestuarii]
MSKVVLHIGTHKTATTTIQDTFWNNAELLAEQGVIYPRMGRVTGHHGLVCDWNPHLPPVYRLDAGSRGSFAALAEAYADKDVTVLLSSEELSRADPKAAVDFAEIRRLLSAFDEIEVLCVLRPQWEFLQSSYLEVSKRGAPPRPPQLVDPVIERGSFFGLYVDYTMLLDRLERVFAPEEITFADFAALRAEPDGILGWMLRHLGCDLPASALEAINGGSSNVSPMPLAGWAANLMAEPKAAPPWLIDTAERVIRRQHGEAVRTCLFSRAEFDRLAAHFDARNALLAERRAAVQPDFAVAAADPSRITLHRDRFDCWHGLARQLAQDVMSLDD